MSWLEAGWQVFEAEPAVADWVAAARPVAMKAVADPQARRDWMRHGGTWFAGVDVLPNDASGAVPGGPPLSGAALAAAEGVAGRLPLHKGQVSVTYPGYPRRDEAEGEAAHGYRLRRDAAHLDGLLPEGPARRRYLREPHGFILGLPLTRADAGAAPLVVYEGSHAVMRAAFREVFQGVPEDGWAAIDVTEAYQAARRRCFETCRRVEVTARPGQAVLVHRLALHGIAPWAEGASAEAEGRAIVYFRPILARMREWVELA